jgi:glutaredoxin 3
MYCTKFCPYCVRARQLLARKGISVRQISVDGDAQRWNEMERITGRNTVPQIFIGDHHVGGFDDLAALDMEGELDPLLKPFLEQSGTGTGDA